MKKTISHINSKKLYRLIKVFYIFLFAGILISFLYLAWVFLLGIDFNNTYVRCNDGRIIKRNSLIENSIYVDFSVKPDDENKIRAMCEHSDYRIIENSLINRNEKPLTEIQLTYLRNKYGVGDESYKLESNYEYIVHSNFNIKNMLIVFIIFFGILSFFEIIKRIFYYVMFGTMLPKK